MPAWQPNWEDVRFDYTGAEEAAAECDGCAGFLRGRHAVLGPPMAEARVEWRGVHRQRFDDEMEAMDRDADLLTDELRMTAARIRAEADEARMEQHARELARERWYQEKAQEEAAERAREEAIAAEAARRSAAVGTAAKPAMVIKNGAIVLTPA